jgi:hypothetical protein
LVSAVGLTLFGLVFLGISEIIYDASDPAQQTHETVVKSPIKERILLTEQRRAEINGTRKRLRALFSTVGGVITIVGAFTIAARIRESSRIIAE